MRLTLIEWAPTVRNCNTHVFSVGWVKNSQEDYVELIQSCYVDGRPWCNRTMRIQRSQIIRQMDLGSKDWEAENW
jgi:hypothetical protein